MTVSEIFTTIAQRMIRGIMIHEQFSNYYAFLGLEGYSCTHYYRYLDESKAFHDLCDYYVNHHNRLINEGRIENPNVIPETWYNYTRQDADPNTKRNAVKDGLEKWEAWERETKALYSSMYTELISIGDIASACFVMCLIKEVDDELCKVEKYRLNKQATGYDLGDIVAEQKHTHKKYKEKICNLMR